MATETSMTKSLTLSKHAEREAVFLTLLNATGAALVAGQEVYISANLTVVKRSTGAQFPIGVVTVGGADAENVTVHTVFQRTLKAHAKGGTINFGTFVKPNGTVNADGCPEYVAAAVPSLSGGTNTSVVGDYCSAIVLSGGAVDTIIELGVFRTPVIAQGAVS